ncbi:MAG: DUF6265 family protein [Bacteroidota bacterium]
MKYLISILIILSSISCSQNNSRDKSLAEHSNATYDFDWLVGSWIRTNDEVGKKTFEYWTKKSIEEYIGFGCTIQNSDTIFKEDLRLIKINEDWNFEVTGVNKNPTLFLFTNQTENSFVCVNENNEFPKRIEYSVDDSVLVANISDKNTEIPFFFEKLLPK